VAPEAIHPVLPDDLPPPPPKWRSYLPAWVRGLVWVDQASLFDAFLSYSWAADLKVAPVVQSVLQKFLCQWYKTRALNIFRGFNWRGVFSKTIKESANHATRREVT